MDRCECDSLLSNFYDNLVATASQSAKLHANRKKIEIVDNGCLLTFRSSYIILMEPVINIEGKYLLSRSR